MYVPAVSHSKLTTLRDKEIYPESHILNMAGSEFEVGFSDFKAVHPTIVLHQTIVYLTQNASWGNSHEAWYLISFTGKVS